MRRRRRKTIIVIKDNIYEELCHDENSSYFRITIALEKLTNNFHL